MLRESACQIELSIKRENRRMFLRRERESERGAGSCQKMRLCRSEMKFERENIGKGFCDLLQDLGMAAFFLLSTITLTLEDVFCLLS